MAKKRKATAAEGFEASPAARKHACVLLEVLSGLKGPGEAAEALSISLPRYYVLETRALEGFVKALEPRERGPRTSSAETLLAEARKEKDALRRELTRAQSMLRMARRAAGLAPEKAKPPEDGKKPKRRKVNRTRRVVALLREREAGESAGTPEEAKG